MQISIHPDLPTDSANYEVLTEGVERVKDIAGMTVEIGLRRGGGSRFIMEALRNTGQKKVHIAIDPYGNIEYADGDVNVIRADYTNDMRDECLMNMYLFARQMQQPFIFFNLEDTEFFARFGDGVPTYSETKTVETEYSFVHFDGPHSVKALTAEIDFFHRRTPTGAVFVFDDVALYDHDTIHGILKGLGWSVFKTTPRKWAYVKM